MNKTNDNIPSINYFKGIDVLRFICATGVIFHHTTSILNDKGFKTSAAFFHRNSGSFFLDVFFVISGFLISLILMKEYKLGTFSIKNFYLRRIIRIWPLYFLIVITKILIIPVFTEYIVWDNIKTNLIYASTFFVNYQLLLTSHPDTYTILWSICIEEHIYLLLPLFLFIFKGNFKFIGWFLVISGFISWAYFKGIISTSGFNTPYFVSSSYFLFFGIGTLIAWFHNHGTKLKLLFFPPIQTLLLVIIMLFVFNIIPHPSSGLIKILLLYSITSCYLVWAATQDNFIIPVKIKFAKYLGNISYGMYITHIMIAAPTIKYFKKGGFEFSELLVGWGIPCITTLLTIALATLLYYSFERPILKFKKRFTTVQSK